MSGRAARRSVAVLAVLGVLLVGPGANAATPQQLFATDSSGMLKVNVVCAHNARQYGSGFLLGPNVMMTARHVLVDEVTGKSCAATVVQDGTRRSSHVVRWMAIRATHSGSPTDLAIGVLAQPLTGYNFTVSSASPKIGRLVVALGYGLKQPLSLNQGHVKKLLVHDSVRLIEMDLAEVEGASGGPILDANGKVIGLVQVGAEGEQVSVDVPHLVGDNPTQFCFDDALGHASTICPRHGAGAPLLSTDGPPAICAGLTIDLPFDDCPKFADDATGVVHLSAQCPKAGAEGGSGFLLGPRLVMTARSVLIDPDTAANCPTTAVQTLTGKSVRVVRWMGLQIAGSNTSTDIALAILASPLQGYHFAISPVSPEPGQTVHVLNYILGFPETFNKAHVVKLPTENGVRQIEVGLRLVAGDGGGPIVNAHNQVVGLTQWGSTTVANLLSVDLANITDGDPTQLCFGDAWAQVSTICLPGKHSQPATFVRDTTPEICGSVASDPPFSLCQFAGASASPTITSCWVSADTSPDSSDQVTQVSDVYPAVYFHAQLAEPGTSETTESLAITSPDGTVTNLVTNRSIGPVGANFWNGPLGWNHGATGHVADGVWTYKMTLSSGATCSATFTTASG